MLFEKEKGRVKGAGINFSYSFEDIYILTHTHTHAHIFAMCSDQWTSKLKRCIYDIAVINYYIKIPKNTLFAVPIIITKIVIIITTVGSEWVSGGRHDWGEVGASWAGAPSQRRRHTVPTTAAISANKPNRRKNVSLFIFFFKNRQPKCREA